MNYMLQLNRGGRWVNQQRYTDIWDYRKLHDSIAANMLTDITVSSLGMSHVPNTDWRLKRLPDPMESEV